MNEFDQFVKHKLKIKCYIRYCDDFLMLSDNEQCLINLISVVREFLGSKLKLELHKKKIKIHKLKQGIDFLGYVVLPHHTVLRTKTKRRMFKRARWKNLFSYIGLLIHCNGYKLQQKILRDAFS